MKMISKNITLLLASILGLALISSCKKGLDYTNNGVIVPEAVWGDANMINAYLNDIYGASMPGWPFNGPSSDEAINNPKSLNNNLRGIITEDNQGVKLDYEKIDKINFFLDELEAVPTHVLSTEMNKQYAGEAKFWRAWHYWNMVNMVGGVPLILHKQNFNDIPSLFLPRNKTSDCVAQIVKDLDSAILLLPGVYSKAEVDYGRITKVAAMAMKGRVLLSYASPLFNPSNNPTRWENAYNACKIAVEYGREQGHDLHPNFHTIWTDERNKEVVMVNQYFHPNHTTDFSDIRPISGTNNQPLLTMLLAFPKKDGSPMQLDKSQLSNETYNSQFMTDFYTNRDDRFYATVFCGGRPYPSLDEPPFYNKGESFWSIWRQDEETKKYSLITNVIHPNFPGNLGSTGFYQRKGIDTTQVRGSGIGAQTDWVEMRYAELLLNYGEAANEAGKTAEAIDVLKSIRKRAGVTPGANENYGLVASNVVEIREAYIRERQVELAFENKRFNDLRRLKRFDILNDQGARHGLYITVKDMNNLPLRSETITNAKTREKLTARYVDNLDGDESIKFNLDLNHWFYPIAPSHIAQSKDVLKQNKEWGGTFDPLL